MSQREPVETSWREWARSLLLIVAACLVLSGLVSLAPDISPADEDRAVAPRSTPSVAVARATTTAQPPVSPTATETATSRPSPPTAIVTRTPTPASTPTATAVPNVPTPAATATATPTVEREVALTITIDAAQSFPGVDTGLELSAGQTLAITATGRAQYSDVPQVDCAGWTQTDPNGNRYVDDRHCDPKLDSGAVMPAEPIGALIARVGDGPWFRVGTKLTIVVQTSGRLVLLYNDAYGTWENNAGDYVVIITVSQS